MVQNPFHVMSAHERDYSMSPPIEISPTWWRPMSRDRLVVRHKAIESQGLIRSASIPEPGVLINLGVSLWLEYSHSRGSRSKNTAAKH